MVCSRGGKRVRQGADGRVLRQQPGAALEAPSRTSSQVHAQQARSETSNPEHHGPELAGPGAGTWPLGPDRQQGATSPRASPTTNEGGPVPIEYTNRDRRSRADRTRYIGDGRRRQRRPAQSRFNIERRFVQASSRCSCMTPTGYRRGLLPTDASRAGIETSRGGPSRCSKNGRRSGQGVFPRQDGFATEETNRTSRGHLKPGAAGPVAGRPEWIRVRGAVRGKG